MKLLALLRYMYMCIRSRVVRDDAMEQILT